MCRVETTIGCRNGDGISDYRIIVRGKKNYERMYHERHVERSMFFVMNS